MSTIVDDVMKRSLWLAFAAGWMLATPAMAAGAMQGMDMANMPVMPMPATQAPHPSIPPEKQPKKTHHPNAHQHDKKPKEGVPVPVPAAAGNATSGTPAPAMPQESMRGIDMQSQAESGPAAVVPTTHDSEHMNMTMRPMQGGAAPPGTRRTDYSDGQQASSMPGMDMRDDAAYGMLHVDQFEYAHGRGDNALFVDGNAYYGTDLNNIWLKAEGERSRGSLRDLRAEVLWDHAFTTYFSTQFGVRHDFDEGPGRSWVAFGVQGLAPYWFETEAALYIGEQGRTAARLQVEYDARITQRLIMQPRIELNLYGRDDPQRGIGSGLSDSELGFRLRYEIRREIAPYVGVVYRQRYGKTTDATRLLGEPSDDLQLVAGIRFWF